MKTFDVLWEMSEPGSETEGLFLRIDRKDYYEVEPRQGISVEWMPNVLPTLGRPGFELRAA